MEKDEAYRMLGLGEDSDFAEMEDAYTRLTDKYSDDFKMKVKLKVARDAVIEASMSNMMPGSSIPSQGLAVNPFEVPEAKKPKFSIPPAFRGFMELPTKKYLVQNAALFGAIGFIPILSRSFVPTAGALGFGLGLFRLYQRGVAAPNSDDAEEIEVSLRDVRKRPFLLATGITVLSGAMGVTLSSVVGVVLRKYLATEVIATMGMSAGFFTSATLFKVQDEEE
jgi:hypothetical protein